MRSPWLFLAVSSMLSLGGCGAPETSSEPGVASTEQAIVGGEIDRFRNYVGQLVETDGSECSGILISPRRVITAGHCLQGSSAKDLKFRTTKPDGTTLEIRQVKRRVAHPNWRYSANYTRFDIGLAILDKPIEGVRVPRLSDVPDGWEGVTEDAYEGDCTVAAVGYGQTESGEAKGSPGKDARKKAEGCVWAVRNRTLSVHGESGSGCFGDSGGPLLIRGTDGVVGVFSWIRNAECSKHGFTLYSRYDENRNFVSCASISNRSRRAACLKRIENSCPLPEFPGSGPIKCPFD